jgi:hypothetical protein
MIDDDDPTLARSRRKLRWLIITTAVTAVGLGGFLLTVTLPKRAIERAHQDAIDCVNAIYETGEGDPADCRQSGAMFALARMLPWSRDRARQEQAEIEALVLEHQLDVASVRDLDIEVRDRAARELVALQRGDYPPRKSGSSAFARIAEAGAHELVVELVSAEDSTWDRNRALQAALLLGQWEPAGSIARTSAAGDMRFARNAAIVACILGDRETATARLQEGAIEWKEYETTASLDGKVIALHCDLPPSDEPLDSFTAEFLHDVATLYQPGTTLDTRHLSQPLLAMTIARMAVAQTEPLALGERLHEGDLLDRIGTHHGGTLMPVLVHTRDERPSAGPMIVAEIEAGARRLAELAATAHSEHTFEFDGLKIRPRERLIWGAFCLASLAATERAWRGQLDEARAIQALVRELAATEEFRTFGLGAELPVAGQYALLDFDEVLRVARSAEQFESSEPTLADMFRIQLALVHEQAGEFDRAVELTAAETGARWVHGSMLLRAGREGELQVQAPSELRGSAPNAEVIFAYWWTAALADPAAQARHRWLAGGESKLWLGTEPWSLPFALELLARSAPAEHRDLWLDTVSADILLVDPLTMIRARATAAERLGDTAAVERWRGREAALLERLRDDRAAALYRMLQ